MHKGTYKDFYMSQTRKQTALDQGQTDRISLTLDPDLQSPASYGHD